MDLRALIVCESVTNKENKLVILIEWVVKSEEDGGQLEASTIRVLVVDDYEPFRRFVCATIGERQDMQLIGEAADGLNAICKAEKLKPDLIVLDIGLPTLNGIEARGRIYKLCPECKILFLSQEHSLEVAQEAFNFGAMGYIVKAHAGSELSPALEAVPAVPPTSCMSSPSRRPPSIPSLVTLHPQRPQHSCGSTVVAKDWTRVHGREQDDEHWTIYYHHLASRSATRKGGRYLHPSPLPQGTSPDMLQSVYNVRH